MHVNSSSCIIWSGPWPVAPALQSPCLGETLFFQHPALQGTGRTHEETARVCYGISTRARFVAPFWQCSIFFIYIPIYLILGYTFYIIFKGLSQIFLKGKRNERRITDKGQVYKVAVYCKSIIPRCRAALQCSAIISETASPDHSGRKVDFGNIMNIYEEKAYLT